MKMEMLLSNDVGRMKKAGAETCPVCGITYHEFRTGLDFAEVKTMFWSPNPDPSTWRYKRRRTVLGKWHQIKQEMWAHHLENCEPVEVEAHTGPLEY